MKNKLTTLDLVHIALLTVLISIGGFIKIPFPLVPITLQFFFVNLGALIFNKNKGSIAVALYIFIGLIGIPVFTGGGGPQYVFHPTFGYLIGMLVGVFVASKIKDKIFEKNVAIMQNKKEMFKVLICVSLINIFVVYALGLPFMMAIVKLYLGLGVPVSKLVLSGFLLTIPGDIIKIIIGSIVALKIDNNLLNRYN